MSKDDTATKTRWNNFPIDNPKRIDITLQLTDKQFAKLTKGLIPHKNPEPFGIIHSEWGMKYLFPLVLHYK